MPASQLLEYNNREDINRILYVSDCTQSHRGNLFNSINPCRVTQPLDAICACGKRAEVEPYKDSLHYRYCRFGSFCYNLYSWFYNSIPWFSHKKIYRDLFRAAGKRYFNHTRHHVYHHWKIKNRCTRPQPHKAIGQGNRRIAISDVKLLTVRCHTAHIPCRKHIQLGYALSGLYNPYHNHRLKHGWAHYYCIYRRNKNKPLQYRTLRKRNHRRDISHHRHNIFLCALRPKYLSITSTN